jgi:DNA polymerase III subunit delta'
MSVFDDLIDQDAVVTTLKAAAAASKTDNSESQEMTHAWLFTGPPGSGRSNAAMAFAAALVCAEGGCGSCVDCTTVKNGTHADVEVMSTDGLSIKIDEVRELVLRAAWAPSVSRYRVVVMEDADRLTESAANALLKAVEEPNQQTVWLLCAPSTTDVLPTIRSRTRSLILRTPSNIAVANLLVTEGISPAMASFASSASQGHVGRARYLATHESARSNREEILKSVLNVRDISSAFAAAQSLVDSAKADGEADAESRNEKEIQAMKDAWGTQTTKISSSNTKAIKELEKEQKSRSTRMVRDYLDRALLDIASLYRDVLMVQSGQSGDLINKDLSEVINESAARGTPSTTLARLHAVMETRKNLGHNAAPLLTVEAMLLQLK